MAVCYLAAVASASMIPPQIPSKQVHIVSVAESSALAALRNQSAAVLTLHSFGKNVGIALLEACLLLGFATSTNRTRETVNAPIVKTDPSMTLI